MAAKGTGSFLMTMLLQLIGFAGVAVLQLPSYVLIALASFGLVPMWVAYTVALPWSILILEGAVRVGGRVWDRYAVAGAHHDSQLAGTLITALRFLPEAGVAHWGAPASSLCARECCCLVPV